MSYWKLGSYGEHLCTRRRCGKIMFLNQFYNSMTFQVVKDEVYLNEASVLPHKVIAVNVPSKDIIM